MVPCEPSAKRKEHTMLSLLYWPGFGRLRVSTSTAARTGEETQEIHEMADLAEDAASALQGIVEPVIGGKEACIHPIVERQWFVQPSARKLFMSKASGAKRRLKPTMRSGRLGIAMIVVRR